MLWRILVGKTIIVTGAGRGIGRQVAQHASSIGAQVIVNDSGASLVGNGNDRRPASTIVETILAAGGTAVPNFDSISTFDGCERLVRSALDSFGRIDGLVNAAGNIPGGVWPKESEDSWSSVTDVHVGGHWGCIQAVLPTMLECGYGSIVNVSSEAAIVPHIGGVNSYSVAKAAIIGITEAIARLYGSSGITCNAIVPRARTRLNRTQANLSISTQKKVDNYLWPNKALDRYARPLLAPRFITPLVCLLLSEQGCEITGTLFRVYGGIVRIAQSSHSTVLALNKDENAPDISAMMRIITEGV